MRHYDSSSLKDNVVDNFQKVSTKPYDETKNQKNNLAFTDDSRESRSIGPCLYKARGFNAFENIEFVVDTREKTGKKYCKQKINTSVTMRKLVNDDIRDKYHNNKKSIASSGSHVFVLFYSWHQCFIPIYRVLKFYIHSRQILNTIFLKKNQTILLICFN